MTFEKVNIDKKEIYILDNFNINLYHINRYIVRDDNTFLQSSSKQNQNR